MEGNPLQSQVVASNDFTATEVSTCITPNPDTTAAQRAMVIDPSIGHTYLQFLLQQDSIVANEPTVDVNQSFQDLIDPTTNPIWLQDADALNPDMELPPIQTWCEIGGRKALPKQGVVIFYAKPKQGKSMATNALTIPLLTGQDFDTVKPLDKPNLVVVFDLEMGTNTLLTRLKLHHKTLGDNKTRFVIYSLLGQPRDKCLEIIWEKISKWNPDIVIVDQLANITTNINDPAEAARIMNFMKMIGKTRSVWAVIHENKGGDNNPRGHMGTESSIGCVESYSVYKSKGVFHIKGQLSRDTDMEGASEVCFCFDPQNGIIDGRTSARLHEELRMQNQEIDLRELFNSVLHDCPEGLTSGKLRDKINKQRKDKKMDHWSKETIRKKRDDALRFGILIKKQDPDSNREDRYVYLLNNETKQAISNIDSMVALNESVS